jgi:hypothetical protein
LVTNAQNHSGEAGVELGDGGDAKNMISSGHANATGESKGSIDAILAALSPDEAVGYAAPSNCVTSAPVTDSAASVALTLATPGVAVFIMRLIEINAIDITTANTNVAINISIKVNPPSPLAFTLMASTLTPADRAPYWD